MSKMKRSILCIWLSLCMVLNVIAPNVLLAAGTTADTQSGTVVVSIEKFCLGQGYILEPVEVPYSPGMTVQKAITLAAVTTSPAIQIEGLDAGYITSIADEMQPVTLPVIMQQAMVGPYSSANFEDIRIAPQDNLKWNDYGKNSGWMCTVDEVMPSVGIQDAVVEPGQVVRLRYTLTWGADFGTPELDFGTKFYQEANKLQLMRQMAKLNNDSTLKANNAVLYNEALDLTAQMDAPQIEVDALVAQLSKIVPITTIQNPLEAKEAVLTSNINSDSFNTTYTKGSGMDWSAFTLARGGKTVPTTYVEAVRTFISKYSDSAALNSALVNPTEFERMVIGLTAAGYDATKALGYDLTAHIYNNKNMETQGINAFVYGLLALDTKPYYVPNDALYSREKLIQLILNSQLSDGGFAYAPEWGSDYDLTAMAIQALAPYYATNTAVKSGVDKALKWLSEEQKDNGGYVSWGEDSSESVAQVICALTSLGKDPIKEAAFIKPNGNLLTHLMSFYDETSKGFKHTVDGPVNALSTGQASYALIAYERFNSSKTSLFDMSDLAFLAPIIPQEGEYIYFPNGTNALSFSNDAYSSKIIVIALQEGEKNNTLDITGANSTLPQMKIQTQGFDVEIPKDTVFMGKDIAKLSLLCKVKDETVASQIKALAQNNSKTVTVLSHIALGSTKESIQFNQKVKIIFKNAAKYQAAYRDYTGKVYVISKLQVGADKSGYNEYCYEEDNDLIVETNHFTDFIVYSAAIAGGTGTGGSGQSVKVYVERQALGLSDLFNGTVAFEEGDTVYSALKKTGLSVSTSGSGSSVYVSGINGLNELAYGPTSGWMYSVNDSFPTSAAGAYKISSGDTIKWQYTKSLGKDIGAPAGSGSGGGGGIDTTSVNDVFAAIKKSYAASETLSDWQLFGLTRLGVVADQKHYEQLISKVEENKGTFRKITDGEKIVLALSSIGTDCTKVKGYNLVANIYNHKNLTSQGNNGIIFGLLALDSKAYDIPKDAVWTREKLKETLIAAQNTDGGFPLVTGETSDTDVTAMALQALATYKNETSVNTAIQKALTYLSNKQKSNGQFEVYGAENSESLSQVIIALSTLQINLASDERFIKEDKNLVQLLLEYQASVGNFSHKKGEAANAIATEQALLALESYMRYVDKKASLFELKDVTIKGIDKVEEPKVEVTKALNFTDTAEISSWAKAELQEAVALGIIQGYGDTLKPQKQITRAEFLSMLMRLLEEDKTSVVTANTFKDIKEGAWYKEAVLAAYQKGIVTGITKDSFGPSEQITREQMAVMVAKLCENETNSLVSFKDGKDIASWAKTAVSLVYSQNLIKGYQDNSFKPKAPVTREMAAVILLRMKKAMKQSA